MFSKTVKGAEVTCAMYSLVKTAIANGLDPRKCLNYLLKNLPYKEMESFNYEDYLPWSDKIPEEIKVISKNKKGRKPNALLPLNQLSVSEIISSCSTLMCLKKDNMIYIETPIKTVKEYFNIFGLKITGNMTVDELKKN